MAEHLKQREIESFLPLYQRVSRWKNGMRMRLELPLFPGYVFVRMNPFERLRVLETPSVSSLVGCGGQPVPLPDQEIEILRAGVARISAEPHPFLAVGDKVRVKFGPLAGLEGFLVQKKNETRFVLSMNLIMRAVSVEVDSADVEPLHTRFQRLQPISPFFRS